MRIIRSPATAVVNAIALAIVAVLVLLPTPGVDTEPDPDHSPNRAWRVVTAVAWSASFAATIGGVGAAPAGVANPTETNTYHSPGPLVCQFFLILGEGYRRTFADNRRSEANRWSRAWWRLRSVAWAETGVLVTAPWTVLYFAVRAVHQAVLP